MDNIMARIKTDRKTRLRAALQLTSTTKQEFARQLGCHYVHLNAVLRGERESPRLISEVDRFIADVERRMAARVNNAAA